VLVPRYYNGVLLRRTTISCVTVAFFVAVLCVTALATDITFPVTAKWTVTLAAAPAYAPAFDDDHAYVPLQTNQLVALTIAEGKTTWSLECPMTTAPAAGDGLVFAGSEGLIEARAKADGRAQWRRPVEGRVTSLHWDTGWLLASTETGPLLALRAIDGEVIWRRELGSPLQSPPVPAGDRVYLPLKDGRIVAVSIQTGEQIWTRKLAEAAVGILPVGDRLYVGALDNRLHSLDVKDGDDDWSWPTGADLLGTPVLDRKRVYFVALDNVLRGHDRNSGSMIWKQVLPMRPFTGPLLSGESLIVSGVASDVRAYSTADGKQTGAHVLKGAESQEILLATPPYLTSQGLLILTAKNGQVHALGSTPPADAAPPAVAPPAEATAPSDAAPPADATSPANPAPSPTP
jgi:outer membrane protein assembly factor BamB